MGFIKEFKDFAMKGNVVDLAVAVLYYKGRQYCNKKGRNCSTTSSCKTIFN